MNPQIHAEILFQETTIHLSLSAISQYKTSLIPHIFESWPFHYETMLENDTSYLLAQLFTYETTFEGMSIQSNIC